MSKSPMINRALMPILIIVSVGNANDYGGEEFPDGNPWHHYDIIRRAAAGDAIFMRNSDEYAPDLPASLYLGTCFTRDAALALAWHADWVDSYLYNPLFWVESVSSDIGSDMPWRVQVAYGSREDLVKVHFDDLTNVGAIQDSFQRYISGATTALNWAAVEWASVPDEDKARWLHAGFNAVGVSMHAVQEFYSHSNWMDEPARRSKIYFAQSENESVGQNLWAEAYEEEGAGSPGHHGKLALECSAYKQDALDPILGVACSGISPVNSSGMCTAYNACDDAEALDIRVNFPVIGTAETEALPDAAPGLLYLFPPGINLDNTIFSEIGLRERRNMRDKDNILNAVRQADACKAIINRVLPSGRHQDCSRQAHFMFANSKHLAIEASQHWLRSLDTIMKGESQITNEFWQAMKLYRAIPEESSIREAQYENFSFRPYNFLTAGPYPVRSNGESEGIYLRLDIKTSNRSKAGTDADIEVHIPGRARPFILDYSPNFSADPDHPVETAPLRPLGYNDFEKNSHDAYIIGPFNELPENITLENNDANVGEVFEAFGEGFVNTMKVAVEKARTFGLSILSGDADHIQTANVILTSDELAHYARTNDLHWVHLNGEEEGHYRIGYRIQALPDRLDGWKRYRIIADHMICVAEAPWTEERGNSDEPFFIFLVSALVEEEKQYEIFGSFDDVDTGERRPSRNGEILGQFDVDVAPHGYVTIAIRAYESDIEREARRRDYAEAFVTGITQEERIPRGQFVNAIGRAVAPDWHIDYVKVHAFKRSAEPVFGKVADTTLNRWLDGGQRVEIQIDASGFRPLKARPYDVLNQEWQLQQLLPVMTAVAPIYPNTQVFSPEPMLSP